MARYERYDSDTRNVDMPNSTTCPPCSHGEHQHCYHHAVYEPCACAMSAHGKALQPQEVIK
jgi:hypothetical protein